MTALKQRQRTFPPARPSDDKNKTLLGKASEGHIILKAAAKAARSRTCPLVSWPTYSINFVVQVAYASKPIPVTVVPKLMSHFAERLIAAVRAKKTPLCVGLDPRFDSLPPSIRRRHGETLHGRARAFEEFCARVLDVVAPLVGVIKPQSAFFEACGPAGLDALLQIMRRAKRLGLVTILDAKRNDIASTAEAYAETAFQVYDADAVTVNAYLGRDSIEPFLKIGRPLGRGLFILVRTSNKGAGQFQDLTCDGTLLHIQVARAVQSWSKENLGPSGFGDVGAVVGATSPAELKSLRQHLPSSLILVPGYGAQGASAADTAGAFRPDGLGAVVNSSRGILFPYDPAETRWEEAVETATKKANGELGSLPGIR